MDKNIKESIWELVQREAKEITLKFPNDFQFNETSEYVFLQKFDEYYDDIKHMFMKKDVEDLDAHKIAAVIICSVIDANVLKVNYVYDEEEKLFCGNEKIAVKIGLSYMRSALMNLLAGTEEEGKFEDYIFPSAIMCDTDYVTILCRNMYYAKTYFKLNPIDIANTLFLLESITLSKLDINIETVKNKCKELTQRNVLTNNE